MIMYMFYCSIANTTCAPVWSCVTLICDGVVGAMVEVHMCCNDNWFYMQGEEWMSLRQNGSVSLTE